MKGMNNICSINQKWVREPSPDPNRRKLASRGERLSSEKARAIAGKTRANNLIKREVNSIITEETNTAFSKVGSSIVKGRRNKNE